MFEKQELNEILEQDKQEKRVKAQMKKSESTTLAVEKLVFQPPHPLNKKEKDFESSLTPKEKDLHKLATEMLGSSYFMGKTHGYRAWEKAKK
jgi:hypothetical protein